MTKMTKSTSIEVDEVISYMQRKLGCVNDAELANMLEISPSSISAWRRRQKIPKKYEKQIEFWVRKVPTLDHQEFRNRKVAYSYGALAFASNILHTKFAKVEGIDIFLWFGFRLVKLHKYCDRRLSVIEVGNEAALTLEFQSIIETLDREDIVEWIDALEVR